MDSDSIYPIYVLLKYLAYAGWSALGLWQFRHAVRLSSAAGFGLLRLLIGVGFGISIFAFAAPLHLDVPSNPIPLYLAVYAPVRWVEWSLLLWLISRREALGFRFGGSRPQFWIFGGIAVSFLADLPVTLFAFQGAKNFLPVGRFLC
jgi:hypothetical protein